MDSSGNIYELDEQTVSNQPEEVTKEDVARLDGFLRGRAEAAKLNVDKVYKNRGHERLVHDSSRGNTYTKESKMGIEGIETLSGHSDPGDEQPETSDPAPDSDPVPVPDTSPPEVAPEPEIAPEPQTEPTDAG